MWCPNSMVLSGFSGADILDSLNDIKAWPSLKENFPVRFQLHDFLVQKIDTNDLTKSIYIFFFKCWKKKNYLKNSWKFTISFPRTYIYICSKTKFPFMQDYNTWQKYTTLSYNIKISSFIYIVCCIIIFPISRAADTAWCLTPSNVYMFYSLWLSSKRSSSEEI